MTRNEFLKLYLDVNTETARLIGLVPAGKESWRPHAALPSCSDLLHELTQDAANVQGLLRITSGEWQFDEAAASRVWSAGDALKAMQEDVTVTRELLEEMSDETFQKKILTASWGATHRAEIILLQALVLHKNQRNMQLYLYLKMLGVSVETPAL